MSGDITTNYHGGNAEAVGAHTSIRSEKVRLRQRVIDAIDGWGSTGATCDEIEVELALAHQTASARVTEAKARGSVVATGARRATRSGRAAMVYVTPRHT